MAVWGLMSTFAFWLTDEAMKTSVIIRFAVVALLWLWLVGMILTRTRQVTLFLIFMLIASGIIVFVPMYKKYVKKNDAPRR